VIPSGSGDLVGNYEFNLFPEKSQRSESGFDPGDRHAWFSGNRAFLGRIAAALRYWPGRPIDPARINS
jgi:hypothetical protein